MNPNTLRLCLKPVQHSVVLAFQGLCGKIAQGEGATPTMRRNQCLYFGGVIPFTLGKPFDTYRLWFSSLILKSPYFLRGLLKLMWSVIQGHVDLMSCIDLDVKVVS